MKQLTVKEVEYLAYRLAKELLSYNEPIPDFGTRFPNILESCLATPFQSFGGKSLYPSLLAKASILLYLMIKNHPFQNENKRIAITTLLIFLFKNNKWLEVETKKLYDFTMHITTSLPEIKDETLLAIEKFLQIHLVEKK
ncbi:hypothetical protein A2276_00850 [candidate division WOR-1 bacterium RIFOXYA12_FULL_43_27]|uniref:Fido domain-containing protein n=1 Tax=candidate division WOR-1 bacterium RIFOXYC2_FULL_46_14 TaxID=1802587 RepID=A0A1F4U4M0_UNCSA|nr:MAG: hypothetical protein A2276_00850 [candidate division WOR-1 bacterium RIFOXYA12_FULL_43_27]OGC20766.1 MAG: hypothetical protein A2292_07025 [candidate division WOR-1 bacterium RIFOXYB2_FULL_46_45]OGC31497.1 MAG: hypothetical protein A2232_04425 [candidate division WOR-1 bacterium RIFOXYA2_FULL_46_56]OGC39904.1 MAG: hypothetical protein A2438_05265 [candidate division WOR-1 bacterium RIFOXYC2_FULL_46_14]